MQFSPNIDSIEKFWRAANYISAGMLYLKQNALLKHPITHSDFKKNIVGHWGTSPGVNAIYAHTSDLVRRSRKPMRLVVGTGHAGSAILACLYLEETLFEYNKRYSLNEAGLSYLFEDYGKKNGWDTEIAPEYPGSIYSGGELGATLAFSQGCAFNAKDNLTLCLLGDGELETAITQGSWQGFKFLSPDRDGKVLPVINANGFKMGSASLFAMMNREEKIDFFKGHGMIPFFAGANHHEIARIFDAAFLYMISASRKNENPVVVMETPKGWTAPALFGHKEFAGTYNSHKPILKSPSYNFEEMSMILEWLRSYGTEELFDERGKPLPEVTACLPERSIRLGQSHKYNGYSSFRGINTPSSAQKLFAISNKSNMEGLENMLLHLFMRYKDLLVFSPDEASSNRIGRLLSTSGMKYGQRIKASNEMHPGGQVVEILNEHVCFAWAQGYAMTGRSGIFVSYESFAPLLDSMAAQYVKFLARSKSIIWRLPTASLNIILTSLGWRNCGTHHNPGFVDGLLGRNLEDIRVYMPSNATMACSQLEIMLSSSNLLNVMVVSKHNLPRIQKAIAGNTLEALQSSWQPFMYDISASAQISLIAVGDCMAEECLLARDIIHQEIPSLRVQVSAVQELGILDRHAPNKDDMLNKYRGSLSTVWAYLGYPKTIKAMLWNSSHKDAVILGYQDQSRSPAGLSRYVENGASRYHIALAAVEPIHRQSIFDCSRMIAKCHNSIAELHL